MMNIETWPIGRLTPNPLNPRGEVVFSEDGIEELATSIKNQGLLQPIVVTPKGVIIAGHRRHAACLAIRMDSVPVSIRDASEIEQIELMLTENTQRRGLTRLQLATAYQRLIDTGLAVRDLAGRLSVSLASVDKHLNILRLPVEIQPAFNDLPLGYIPYLTPLAEYPLIQIELVNEARAGKWAINKMGRQAERRSPCRPQSKENQEAQSRDPYATRIPGITKTDRDIIKALRRSHSISDKQFQEFTVQTLDTLIEVISGFAEYIRYAEEIEDVKERLSLEFTKGKIRKLLVAAKTEEELDVKRQTEEAGGYRVVSKVQYNTKTSEFYVKMEKRITTDSPAPPS